MSKLQKAADKLAGKTKRVIAEVTGAGELDEEGKQQEKRADEQRGEKPDLGTIANNLS